MLERGAARHSTAPGPGPRAGRCATPPLGKASTRCDPGPIVGSLHRLGWGDAHDASRGWQRRRHCRPWCPSTGILRPDATRVQPPGPACCGAGHAECHRAGAGVGDASPAGAGWQPAAAAAPVAAGRGVQRPSLGGWVAESTGRAAGDATAACLLVPEPVAAFSMRCAGVAMDVMWDLLVFLALVAVGLVLLNLLARRR